MKYQTQRVAYPFFVTALLLFAAQVLFGVLAGLVYVLPNFLAEAMPFHIMRMSHTNLLLVWLLTGFFGATYYLMPEEAETELHSPMIAYVQLAIFPCLFGPGGFTIIRDPAGLPGAMPGLFRALLAE